MIACVRLSRGSGSPPRGASGWIADDTQLGDDGIAGVTIWASFLCGSVLFGLLARRSTA